MSHLLPDRLASARERLLLTQGQVAERTGIGESSISEFENGKREPSLSQLQSLATAYSRSLSWLLGEGEGLREETVLWRARPDPAVAAGIEGRFMRLCQNYRNLEIWCGAASDVDMPSFADKAPGDFRTHDAAMLAKRVRDELALGDRPGESLQRTLEETCGIKIFHLDFEPSGTAACARNEAFGAGILLNKKNVPWRRTFDVAHEFFHLLVWHAFKGEWSGDPLTATDREESLANAFASNLLLPEEPFRLAVQRRTGPSGLSTIDHAYAVAREFGVSVDAVLVRAIYVFKLESKLVDDLRSQWKVVGPVYESRQIDSPAELPDRYFALAIAALKRGEIAAGKFADYTGMSRQKAFTLLQDRDEPTDAPDTSVAT